MGIKERVWVYEVKVDEITECTDKASVKFGLQTSHYTGLLKTNNNNIYIRGTQHVDILLVDILRCSSSSSSRLVVLVVIY